MWSNRVVSKGVNLVSEKVCDWPSAMLVKFHPSGVLGHFNWQNVPITVALAWLATQYKKWHWYQANSLCLLKRHSFKWLGKRPIALAPSPSLKILEERGKESKDEKWGSCKISRISWKVWCLISKCLCCSLNSWSIVNSNSKNCLKKTKQKNPMLLCYCKF